MTTAWHLNRLAPLLRSPERTDPQARILRQSAFSSRWQAGILWRVPQLLEPLWRPAHRPMSKRVRSDCLLDSGPSVNARVCAFRAREPSAPPENGVPFALHVGQTCQEASTERRPRGVTALQDRLGAENSTSILGFHWFTSTQRHPRRVPPRDGRPPGGRLDGSRAEAAGWSCTPPGRAGSGDETGTRKAD